MDILVIDQGTSATKALLVQDGGQVLGRGEVPVRVRSVDGSGVGADPEELLASVLAAGAAALAASGARADAVALANQGETVLAWDLWVGPAALPSPPRSSGRTGGPPWCASGSRTGRASCRRSPGCRLTHASPRPR
jgi:hypothetical protein